MTQKSCDNYKQSLRASATNDYDQHQGFGMTDLVFIARRRTQVDSRTHYPGCERDHTECLIQRMADEIERRDEWREWATAEIERLHADNQAAVIAYAAEINEAKAESERLRAALEKAHDVWEAEAAEMRNDIDRLRAELERRALHR